MDRDDDWEIWVHAPHAIDKVSTHKLVAASLDRQTADTIRQKIERLVIIGSAPDVVPYIRRPTDPSYRIKSGKQVLRTRHCADAAKALWDVYRRVFGKGGKCERYGVVCRFRFVQVNNISLRDYRLDMEFVEHVLRDDPVYGRNPLIIHDLPFSYYGEPIPYEYVLRVISSVDIKKIRAIVVRVIRRCKRRQLEAAALPADQPQQAHVPARRRAAHQVRQP